MSIADALNKLNDLKDKGVISQAEFDKQKTALLGAPSGTKPKGRQGVKIMVSVAGAVMLVLLLVANFNKGSAGLPGCDSQQAKSTLGEAFNRSQFAREMKLSAVEVTGTTEKAFDAQANKRSCTAKVAMNNLSTAHVAYVLQGRADGQFMLTFEVVDESAAPAPTAQVEAAASTPVAAASSVLVAVQPDSKSPTTTWQRQCVVPKSAVTAEKLVVHGTQVFDSPEAANPSSIIKLNIALWAVEKRGDWLKLTGAVDSAPYADGVTVGWVKEAEIDPQDLRNCN